MFTLWDLNYFCKSEAVNQQGADWRWPPGSRMLISQELPGTPEEWFINGFGFISIWKRWQGRMVSFQQCYFRIISDKTWSITIVGAAVLSITVKRPPGNKGGKEESGDFSLESSVTFWHYGSSFGATIRADTVSREAVKKCNQFPKNYRWSPQHYNFVKLVGFS